MLSQSSLRILTFVVALSILIFDQGITNARPVEQYGDAPPFTRSIGMSLRGDPCDSNSDDSRNTSLLSLDVGTHLNLRSVKTLKQEVFTVETFNERGLVGDTLKGLMGPLSILPGFVQVSDILFGDGKQDTGLFGKLGGLLLTVEPSTNNSTDSDASSEGNKNATAVNQAAQASMRYSLSASKKHKTQVFLVPVYQANAEPDSSAEASNITSTNKNDTMTVKMMMHMLNTQGAPIVMCASYGSSPPTNLGVDECSGENVEQKPSDGNTTQSSQLFTYKPSTGALTPMFANAKGDGMDIGQDVSANAGAGNTTVNATSSASTQQEMRMHFVMAVSPDAASTQGSDENDPSSPSSTDAAAANSTSGIPAPSAPASADSKQMQRITLGREIVQKAQTFKLSAINTTEDSSSGSEDAENSAGDSASTDDKNVDNSASADSIDLSSDEAGEASR